MNNRHFINFTIAGFSFYEGVDVFNELNIGTELQLQAEPDNKFDPYAVMVLYTNHKLGYVPRGINKELHKILLMGYTHIFVAKINRVSPDEHPEQQISVLVRIVQYDAGKNREI